MMCNNYQPLSEYGFAYGLKTETRQFSKNFSCEPHGKLPKKRKHSSVRVQIEYGFDCFHVRFGLVVSTVWIGSEYGFVILVDASASKT